MLTSKSKGQSILPWGTPDLALAKKNAVVVACRCKLGAWKK